MKALRWTMCAALAFGSAMMVGCDDKKPDPVPAPKTDTGTPGGAMLDKAKGQATDMMKNMTDTGKGMAGKTGDAVKNATDTGAMAGMNHDAMDWLGKLKDAVEAGKLDDAKTYLDKLDAISSKLSPDQQSQLTTLRTALAAAKAKAGAALPGGASIPGLPGANK